MYVCLYIYNKIKNYSGRGWGWGQGGDSSGIRLVSSVLTPISCQTRDSPPRSGRVPVGIFVNPKLYIN